MTRRLAARTIFVHSALISFANRPETWFLGGPAWEKTGFYEGTLVAP